MCMYTHTVKGVPRNHEIPAYVTYIGPSSSRHNDLALVAVTGKNSCTTLAPLLCKRGSGRCIQHLFLPKSSQTWVLPHSSPPHSPFLVVYSVLCFYFGSGALSPLPLLDSGFPHCPSTSDYHIYLEIYTDTQYATR